MINGGCLCGAVRYEVDAEVAEFCHCHCSMCRKQHGAGFVSWAGVPRKAFRWLKGEDVLAVYASSAAIDRFFCSACGSSMIADLHQDRLVYLAMGSLDVRPELPVGFHIFAGSKAPWVEILDDLPQYAEWSRAPGS